MVDYREKLGLGTVQFGLDYGISNAEGKTSFNEARHIIDIAAKEGIKTIDTAHLYGDSENILGEILPPAADFNVVTKTLSFRKKVIGRRDYKAFDCAIQSSLDNLQRKNVYGLLMHHADDILAEGGEALWDIMQNYKARGVVSKIGVSVYDGLQIDAVLEKFDIDIAQVPLNIFDQRLMQSGHITDLKARDIEIHVRSAFLQGVVFMEPNALPANLRGLSEPLTRLMEIAQENKTTHMAVALSFLMGNPDIDRVICGVNNAAQLQELCECLKNLLEIPVNEFAQLSVTDPILINPALWR